MSKEGHTSAGSSKTIHVPELEQDTSPVSKPLGGLYAGPASGNFASERQQSPNPTHPVEHRGEYDGHATVTFSAGPNYRHSFDFDLPNVLGTLGVAGLNDEAITLMIEKALIEKFGAGGVVRRKKP